MNAIQLLQLLGGSGARWLVTVGIQDFGGGVFEAGYNPVSGNPGTIAPTDRFQGRLIREITGTDINDLNVGIVYSSDPGQTGAFSRIVVQDGFGVIRTYLPGSADDYFWDSFAGATWRWGSGTDPVWRVADSGEKRSIRIFP